jgi:hypothetical protein
MLGDHRRASEVAVDRRVTEAGVAEHVVPMPVGVHDCLDRPRQQPELVAQLVGPAMAGAGVDDRQAHLAADDADGLVERLVAAHPHAVPDLPPRGGHVPRRTAVPEALTMSMLPWPPTVS